MSLRYYANAPATTLASSCSSGAATVVVTSVTGLPIQYPYTIIIDRGTATEEVLSVTNASGTTLNVSRGADSTTAFAHSIGAEVVHGISAQDPREANAHVNASTAVHGITGSVVGTSDSQTLTNKTLTTPTLNTPTIASFANANHNHTNAAGGGQLTDAALSAAVTVAKGGTGATTLTTGNFLQGNGTGAVTATKAAPAGVVLGTTDAQTVTNKDLSSSTNTFPAAPTVQIFTASGTWTKPAGAKYVHVRLVGGGGGSGGCASTTASQIAAAGGGGAGAYAEVNVSAGSLGATETVTIGAAGTAAAAGANAGGNGGTTSFGAWATAGGGTGGGGSAAVATSATSLAGTGGAGGTAGTGDFVVNGSDGEMGAALAGEFRFGGRGGGSLLGASVLHGTAGTGNVGTTGPNYGSGASGSTNGVSQATRAGAAGSAGVVIVTTYFV